MWEIKQGDALSVLKTMPDQCINTCVTSPPYWGLRDYGVAGQLGLEPTPEEYVANLVEVFREVKRVLRNDGTLWLNLGDSYVTSHAVGTKDDDKGWKHGAISKGYQARAGGVGNGRKPKDLVGIPWMVAFALRADGWYLRSDIIWYKPNTMPESVRDRPTKAHEYIFLLTKSKRYYYDNEAIKEDAKPESEKRYRSTFHTGKKEISGQGRPGNTSNTPGYKKWTGKRNKRSVWTVIVKPFKEAHFATYPPDLIEPCILAGCPEGGVVLDPFMGSGTTGMVAAMHQRNFIGFELNPKYCKMAEKRIEPYLMQQTTEGGDINVRDKKDEPKNPEGITQGIKNIGGK